MEPTAATDATVVWEDYERAAWKPPPRLRPSEWAERFRRLTRRQSARPGAWLNANAPYLVGIMDLCAQPGIEQVNILKAAQVGASEAIRNVIGYWAHTDPDPMLLVLPNEQVGRKIVRKRIIPLLHDTPALRDLLTEDSHDVQLSQILLINGFQMNLGWSGSPSTLASDPIRRVVNDEVDKFQPWSGREADPVSLAYMRTMTYEHTRLIVNVSTPTTRDGLIYRLWEESDVKLWFHVPCPYCGEYQRLTFDRLQWHRFMDEPNNDRRAARIEEENAAWYECRECSGKIVDAHKPRMLQAGVWATDDQVIDGTGAIEGEWPKGKRVGMHISALYCMWVSFAAIAAEFTRSLGDPQKMMNFRNSWLGEVFEEQEDRHDVSVYSFKCTPQKDEKGDITWVPAPQNILPRWTGRLIASADAQKDHFWYTIRAWSAGFRSQRVRHGRAESLEELYEICLATQYRFEGDFYPAIMPEVLGIDIGGTKDEGDELSMTERVYRFAGADARILAVKGDSHPVDGQPIKIRSQTLHQRARSSRTMADLYSIKVHLINTGYIKDLLTEKLKAQVEAIDLATGEVQQVDAWALNDSNDHEYNKQMSAEHCVRVRKSGGRLARVWKPITAGAANHYLDAEVYNYALAYLLRVDLLPPEQSVDAERVASFAKPKRPKHRFTYPDGRPFLVSQR